MSHKQSYFVNMVLKEDEIIKLKQLRVDDVNMKEIENGEPVKTLNKEGCWIIESIQYLSDKLKIFCVCHFIVAQPELYVTFIKQTKMKQKVQQNSLNQHLITIKKFFINYALAHDSTEGLSQ